MAIVKTTSPNLHKILMPGMNALLEAECEKNVREQAEPIIQAVAAEMARRLTATLDSLEHKDAHSGDTIYNVTLKIDYKAGENG